MKTLFKIERTHYPVIIVGGGQAGLSTSYYLHQQKIDHLVIEQSSVMNAWKTKRWDSFSLVTPNWQCNLPGHAYQGDDPHGFMVRDEIIAYLENFTQQLDTLVLEQTTVNQVSALNLAGYQVETSAGTLTADHVVIAVGGYHKAIVPPMADRIPQSICQLHSEQYKNPEQLPAGNVLVVGSGQSGAQIAEDIHLSGRKVHLATGDAPRCARFYRGRDVVDWLADMKYYDMPVEKHPLREGVRDNTNHYVTGRDGGRDIDLRQFALDGMELFGLMSDCDGENFLFNSDLTLNLDRADKTYNSINHRIDDYITEHNIDAPQGGVYEPVWTPPEERSVLKIDESGITSVIWCIGYRPDFSWLNVPVFDGNGQPQHKRGITKQPGLYFVGLPWLYTWGSGRFSGVSKDAEFIVQHLASNRSVKNGGAIADSKSAECLMFR